VKELLMTFKNSD